MDLLKKAFTSYTKLLNIEYSFIVLHTGCMASSAEKKFGAKINKNLIQEIYLKFEKNSFFHFTGLRHAKNSTLSAYDRNYKTIAQFYDDVCNDKITYDEIEKIKDVDPDNKNYIDQRLQLIIDAEKLIDESNSLREYDGFLYKLNEKPKEKLQSANCIIQSRTKIYPKIFYFFSLNSVSEITQNELDQTTTDLLLQETIQTNQKLEELQNSLISIQDLKDTLPESIQNVLNVQLKKILDTQIHNQELLNRLEAKYNEKIKEYQDKTEKQIRVMKLYAEKQINDDCKHLFENAEKSVIAVFNKNAATFNNASKVSLKLICKNLLVNFLVSIVLLAAATGGILFVQNYKDGTKIAKEKAIEVLAKEKETIGKDAINLYKKSSEFREDATRPSRKSRS